MEPRIELLRPKKLIGIHTKKSFSDNKTSELWQQFMPRWSEIKNRLSGEFISMHKYPDNWNFSPNTMFEKWASVEVYKL